MSDSALRELEASVLASPDDKLLRYRFRVECVRLGFVEKAGFQVGDLVRFESAHDCFCGKSSHTLFETTARIVGTGAIKHDPHRGAFHPWVFECLTHPGRLRSQSFIGRRFELVEVGDPTKEAADANVR